ncbi:hypothetical protein B296_00020220, partial [Ensete ventricosum]
GGEHLAPPPPTNFSFSVPPIRHFHLAYCIWDPLSTAVAHSRRQSVDKLTKMKGIELVSMLFFSLPLLAFGSGDVYIVTVEGEPVVSYTGGVDGFSATAIDLVEEMDITRWVLASTLLTYIMLLATIQNYESVTSYALHLEKKHDALLDSLFEVGTYKKLYSYRHLVNGVWPTRGGFDRAGEDIVIGFVDSGIYPKHPSFATHNTEPYGPLPRYRGKCEVDPETQRDFCNGKIIGAQHFAKAAIAAGAFNPAIDFPSPLDGDGHGRIAVYKVLYRLFGGYVSDVVAAIEQAVLDGVDILNLSVGPNSPPTTTKATFLNPFDAALLSAVRAGVFVAQAAGNGGPFPKTLVSFSPWITTVAAAIDDRRYKNNLTLGNGKILPGLGLSRKFKLLISSPASREYIYFMRWKYLIWIQFRWTRMYRSDREPVRVVYRYTPMYCVSVYSVWLGIARYISYRLVSTLVWSGETNHV